MSENSVVSIKVGNIKESASNPNAMESERFALLVEAIRKVGFLQPICVRGIAGGVYEVVDGHHRLAAARELKMEKVPCVVIDADGEKAAALQIGFNRLRGELDLAKVGAAIVGLQAEGWKVEDLALTGFTPDEIDDLVRAVSSDADDVMASAAALDGAEEAIPKPFLLELTFSSREDLQAAKKGLKHAAGATGDMAEGLLRLIGEKD